MSLVLEGVSMQYEAIQLEWKSRVFFDSEENNQIEICDFAGIFDKCVNTTMSVVAMLRSCLLMNSNNHERCWAEELVP